MVRSIRNVMMCYLIVQFTNHSLVTTHVKHGATIILFTKLSQFQGNGFVLINSQIMMQIGVQ
jgi:hypothetical protein